MGGRVSVPRGPDGTSEGLNLPAPASSIRKRRVGANSRALLVPVAGVALAAIFYIYSRTSIQAAKEQAKRYREADGGKINWRNESHRRHGTLEKPAEQGLWDQLTSGGEDAATKERREKQAQRLQAMGRAKHESNPIEEGIRKAREASNRDREE